ncbi:hypothetical protein MMC34_000519 [Xylographa carneopallida]|nr:hypothetical protein [Xylographa carneopallida]
MHSMKTFSLGVALSGLFFAIAALAHPYDEPLARRNAEADAWAVAEAENDLSPRNAYAYAYAYELYARDLEDELYARDAYSPGYDLYARDFAELEARDAHAGHVHSNARRGTLVCAGKNRDGNARTHPNIAEKDACRLCHPRPPTPPTPPRPADAGHHMGDENPFAYNVPAGGGAHYRHNRRDF